MAAETILSIGHRPEFGANNEDEIILSKAAVARVFRVYPDKLEQAEIRGDAYVLTLMEDGVHVRLLPNGTRLQKIFDEMVALYRDSQHGISDAVRGYKEAYYMAERSFRSDPTNGDLVDLQSAVLIDRWLRIPLSRRKELDNISPERVRYSMGIIGSGT